MEKFSKNGEISFENGQKMLLLLGGAAPVRSQQLRPIYRRDKPASCRDCTGAAAGFLINILDYK